MALPSRNQQIEAVVKLLDSEEAQEQPLETIAGIIVDGYLAALQKGLRKPATPLRAGMLLKAPMDSKVHRIAWMKEDRIWLVGETSSYGFLGSANMPLWEYCEEHNPKTYKMIDDKRKLVAMTDEDIEEAWGNPEWRVGDRLSQNQRRLSFQIIATGPQCVLMRTHLGGLVADSNQALAKHYRREITVKEDTW